MHRRRSHPIYIYLLKPMTTPVSDLNAQLITSIPRPGSRITTAAHEERDS